MNSINGMCLHVDLFLLQLFDYLITPKSVQVQVLKSRLIFRRIIFDNNFFMVTPYFKEIFSH